MIPAPTRKVPQPSTKSFLVSYFEVFRRAVNCDVAVAFVGFVIEFGVALKVHHCNGLVTVPFFNDNLGDFFSGAKSIVLDTDYRHSLGESVREKVTELA